MRIAHHPGVLYAPVMGVRKEGVMPKEIVYGSLLPYGEVSSARSVVGVHWSANNYMQLSTSLFNDDLKCMTGDGALHVSEGEEKARRENWGRGFYVDLDRKGVNDLIRNLRRARDQAFGRDE